MSSRHIGTHIDRYESTEDSSTHSAVSERMRVLRACGVWSTNHTYMLIIRTHTAYYRTPLKYHPNKNNQITKTVSLLEATEENLSGFLEILPKMLVGKIQSSLVVD